ncbi:type VI secretion system baseplate subunit TssF [Salmonella enterica]|nr:type VI secretion system baseplate subunit TssF [Salmonella enterica]EGW2853026.1 type VI secretion system baseplate subunit TssF [Salmonella enterica]
MLAKKLIAYYQDELNYLRKFGKIFAHQFPKVSKRLGISEGKSEDPHVERIIESFALITAQIQHRLDDDASEISEALLTSIAPQFLRPYPSVCIVQMQPDHIISGLTTCCSVPAGLLLSCREKITSTHSCRFRTIYPVTLEPVTVQCAAMLYDGNRMQWLLKIDIQTWPGSMFNSPVLRFYLNGSIPTVNAFYTLLSEEVAEFTFSVNEKVYQLTPEDIVAVGFERGEGILERDSRISPVYILMQDYFLFPQKFHFLDFKLPKGLVLAQSCNFSLTIRFNNCAMITKTEKMMASIDKDFFKLNCSPAVNLFSQPAEPVIPNHQQAEYLIVPDVRRRKEVHIWSVDHVSVLNKSGSDTTSRTIMPLFGMADAVSQPVEGLYWQSIRREIAMESGLSSDIFIAFSDRGETPLAPENNRISIETTCYEKDLPSLISNGNPTGDFDSELPLAGVTITALTRPSLSVQQATKKASRWNLISHLSLNQMLMSGKDGVAVIKKALTLYNQNETPGIQRLIELIKQIRITPVTARLIRNDPHSMARGIDIHITFTSSAIEEFEYYLFCCFLERMLALFAPVNSFSRVITAIEFHEGSTKVWPIRTGRFAWL